MTDSARSLHAYLLLDTSASMSGIPLESLKQGTHLLTSTLLSRSTRPVRIGLISYESTAHEIMPLADVKDFAAFTMPPLRPEGSSNLGAAFRLLHNRMIDHDPTLVYLFSDGEPTDDWEVAVQPLRSRVRKICGLACGLKAEKAALAAIADEAFALRDLTPDLVFDTFRAFV